MSAQTYQGRVRAKTRGASFHLGRGTDHLHQGSDLLCRPQDGIVDLHVTGRPPENGVSYICGCDASGGRGDSFTAAIAHREKCGSFVLDLLYERRSPFSPSEVVHEISQLMKEYRCGKITGDGYAAGWVPEAFAKTGIRYEKSEFDRSGVFLNVWPTFTSGQARLLDSPKMISQFAALERRTFSTGRERIDPDPCHDDLANSAAIALSLAAMKKPPLQISDALLERLSHPLPSYGGAEPRVFF